MPKTHLFNNINVECVTLAELARLCGRKTGSLRKAEQWKLNTPGWLPPSNMRGHKKLIKQGYYKVGEYQQGERLYSVELVDILRPYNILALLVFYALSYLTVEATQEYLISIVQLYAMNLFFFHIILQVRQVLRILHLYC